MPGESEFIEWVQSRQRPSDFVPVPPGDDLAVLKWAHDNLLLVGIDQVLDGVHFDSSVHSPRQIGRKAMNRNLSDCAAMACLPAAAVVSAALPRGAGVDYAKEVYQGLRDAADPFDCKIVGGDTGTWDGKLALTVAILGKSGGGEPVTRSGAKPGDTVCVSGPLGGSLLGRHMTFKPRVDFAQSLLKLLRPTAMIDLSDGLSRDLGHICRQSGVGAEVEALAVPVHEDAIEMRRDGRPPLEHALHDGEDYELLFTVPVSRRMFDAAYAPQLPRAVAIGVITEQPGVRLITSQRVEPLEPKGWEHGL